MKNICTNNCCCEEKLVSDKLIVTGTCGIEHEKPCCPCPMNQYALVSQLPDMDKYATIAYVQNEVRKAINQLRQELLSAAA